MNMVNMMNHVPYTVCALRFFVFSRYFCGSSHIVYSWHFSKATSQIFDILLKNCSVEELVTKHEMQKTVL